MSEVTRGEFDMLRDAVTTNARRIDAIDDHGTRGVVALQAQMLDLVKDVGKLEISLENHEKSHVEERKERQRSRRWMIGTAIAGLASMSAVIGLLIEVLMHVH